jgi:hypothetical protein
MPRKTAVSAETIRLMLINSELKALRDFGYEGLTEEGLFDGGICTMFFRSHLKDALEVSTGVAKTVIETLLAEITPKEAE